ncbi:hypothetical protein Dalk_4503 [Desulfatibacillum aliphaticivorans]|uniref:YD repeat protein n=1 Tax=Desulfatibacillum aliphaticivorans TaxID=218208 RepID=B8FCL9_DESAL|nr:hypothetical protein [Desulfatibacillum aliphaticivorans]ACL06182.1 hypothetical protein Dalk_4503 [Desulfatibacillum aliphaticivorans]
MKRNVMIKALGLARYFGMLAALFFLIMPVATPAESVEYTYDSMNRVIKAAYSTGESISYTYDAMGNRLTMSLAGAAGTAVPGDLNGDCRVSLEDAALALQTAAGMKPSVFRADYTSSGADPDGAPPMSLADIVWILQAVAEE